MLHAAADRSRLGGENDAKAKVAALPTAALSTGVALTTRGDDEAFTAAEANTASSPQGEVRASSALSMIASINMGQLREPGTTDDGSDGSAR